MLHVGQTITYVLKPRDCPVNPDHEYHGVIVSVNGTQLKVRLTDPLYADCEEWIEAAQIRSIESKTESREL